MIVSETHIAENFHEVASFFDLDSDTDDQTQDLAQASKYCVTKLYSALGFLSSKH